MQTSPVFPLLLALPPGLALGVGVTLITGRLAWGVAASVLLVGTILGLVLLGTEAGETNLAE